MSKVSVVVGLAVSLAVVSWTAFGLWADFPLQALLEAELENTKGGACLNTKADSNFCQFSSCFQATGVWKRQVGTNVTKRWCGVNPQQGVCDCNQKGIPNQVCVNEATCTGGAAGPATNCTGCGADSPSHYVQAAVNLNGATCNQDPDCNAG